MFDDDRLGRIVSIGDDKKVYGAGYKYFKIRSDDGNREGRLSIPAEMAKGFKKGEWIEYQWNHDGSLPLIISIRHLPTPPHYSPAKCCGTCGSFGRRYTMFAPDRCKKYNTIIESIAVCDEWH